MLISGDQNHSTCYDEQTGNQYILVYDSQNGRVVVNAGHICGKMFDRVALIVDPFTPNPCIKTDRPLGFRATRTIMSLVEKIYGDNNEIE